MLFRLSQFISAFIFSSSFFSSALAGQTYGYFFGGGGDKGKDETIFLPDLQKFSAVSKQKKWITQYIHNGGHREDEAWVKKNIKEKSKTFSVSEFNSTVEELKRKINSIEIKSNDEKSKSNSSGSDQIIIFIASHGEENDKGTSGHNLETIDGTVNVSALKELRDLADRKKIPLVIVDNSCHSGPTLGLASSGNTCVVTMAADDVAYAGDSFRFLKAMKTEKNIEDAFLKGRSMPLDLNPQPGQSQISTDAGKKTGELMKSLKEDLHDYFDVERQSVSEWIPCEARKSSLEDIEKLLAKINSDQRLIPDTQIQDYKKRIKAYRDQENAAIEKFGQIKKLDRKVCFKLSSGYEECMYLSGLEYSRNYNKNEVKKKRDKYGVAKETVSILEKIQNGPQYKAYKAEVDKLKKMGEAFKKLGRDIYQKSRNISKIEREIYSKKYNEFSKKDGKSNPCRNFKL